MADSVLDTYLADVDSAAAPTVRALDAAIRSAHPSFDVAVKYRLLMYTVNRDWRFWVCAVDAHPRYAVGLRFLYGVMLDDPLRVLRPGTSTLETWDFGRSAKVDADAVGRYVREAVAKHGEFKAKQDQVAAAAKAAGGSRRARDGNP